MIVNERPEPSAMDTADVKRRHAAMIRRAWRLIGPGHRRAFNVYRACAGDVYLLNPMSDAKSLIFRILPEAITIAMDEADVPKLQRAETRSLVKLLHGIDAGTSTSDLMTTACLASGCGNEKPEAWREVCPPGTFGCKCRLWWEPFEIPEQAA